MVNKLRLILILLSFSGIATIGQNITATASTDTTDYLVGDYIYYTISVEYDEGVRISPPSLTDNSGRLEVVKVLPVSFEENENIQKFNYILSGYDSSRVVIPPVPLTYYLPNSSDPLTVQTNEVVVFIHTLEVNPAEDIKDIKEPIRMPFDWLFWSLLLLLILALAIIAYYLYMKFKKPDEETRIIKKTPPTPIHILALKALDKLAEKKLWQQGKVKDYHSEITSIIRKYFEDRYHFNSLEMTTAQTMVILNRVMDNQKLIDTTSKFLENADMVKFAKFKPLPSVNEEMMKQAYEIIKKTKPDEVEIEA